MLSFALLPFFAFGLLALVPGLTADDSSDDTIGDPDDPDLPVDPVDPETLGATFDVTDGGVAIEFGENETGRLAIVTYVDTEDSDTDFLQTHEARYYLVPDGVEWPDNTSETASNIPGDTNDGTYLLEDFEEAFNLTLLGTVDLLADGNDAPTDTNMAQALPTLTSNVEAEYYYLEANTDGDELIEFLQEGYADTRNGATQTIVDTSTVGTAENDWITPSVGDVTLEGLAGDDTLGGFQNNLSLSGGDGDDTLTAIGTGGVIDGGAGNDEVRATDAVVDLGDGNDDANVENSTVTGGAGDDSITVMFGGSATGDDGSDVLNGQGADIVLTGGEGDDIVVVEGAGSQSYGGVGDDTIGARDGGSGFGGAGNDRIQTNEDSTVFGGDGDDDIQIFADRTSEGAAGVAWGDEGSDTFTLSVRFALAESDGETVAVIEDFNTAEDVLQVDLFQTTDAQISEVTVFEDPDGAFTEVEVFVQSLDLPPSSFVVRLTGVTGFSADQVVSI
ncbi:calcium-binding protein [Pseudooctadecabacter sp.]|uniref:calcium-binding protein n=1 Tax=Pseudooctadecabacter sp. TaxID=1966338 RepID=UPI0035C8672D